ncbi:hypothetical protein [Flaviaesturariibacter flavus]|nr:hypothetical protein [Flaviaesturariibacter flavus]
MCAVLMKQSESAYNCTAEPWLGIITAVNQITEEFHDKLTQPAATSGSEA